MNKWALVALGVAVGVLIGRWSVTVGNGPSSSPPPAPTPMPMRAEAPSMEPGEVVEGRVAEVIQVSQYTYLRLESGEWAAIPSDPSIAVGQTASLRLQNEMHDFVSPSLNRTFARIWFGNRADGEPSRAPTAAMAPTAPLAPTGSVAAALSAVRSSNVVTLRVVDVYAERAELAGQRVRVRGTVDRDNFVQGVHYVHLKDGSGSATDHTDDLLCTSTSAFEKGATIEFEGVIAVDENVGMGPVAVLLKDAAVAPSH